MTPERTTAPSIERATNEAPVRCGSCGHVDSVGCAVIDMAPTPEIVRQVCERDACPNCGDKTMKPVPDHD